MPDKSIQALAASVALLLDTWVVSSDAQSPGIPAALGFTFLLLGKALNRDPTR